jgi:two-component system response regulator YesN
MWNFDTAEAENAEQTLHLAETRCPDLVLMDTEIEFVKSLITMRKLQSLLKQAAFIMLSGHAQEKNRQIAMAAGAAIYLVKPIDFELLEKSLKFYLLENTRQTTSGGSR